MLLHKGTVPIESSRLLLRKFNHDDALYMFKNWATDEQVTKYLTWRPHSNLKVTQDLVDTWCAHYTKSIYQWTIVLKEIGEPIGSIGIVRLFEDELCADFGYCISSKYWGKGIVTEAMNLLLDYWFNQIGFEKIKGFHHVDNPASGRVMQKIDMSYTGVLKGEQKDNMGNPIDCDCYEITKESFNSLKIRKAYSHEGELVGDMFEKLTGYLDKNKSENKCGWGTGIYPTRAVALSAKQDSSLYVAVKGGKILGSITLNHNQALQYNEADWQIKTDNPLVVHTLAVNPEFFRQGIAQRLLSFAEEIAEKEGSPSIRLDTSQINLPAISLYEKNGYINCGTIDLGLKRGSIKAWYCFEKKL